MNTLLCRFFGHALSAPYFTDDGKWHQECARGDLKVDGLIPAQHQHVLGNKKHSAERGYHYACACGYTEKAPDPVKRAKKPAIDDTYSDGHRDFNRQTAPALVGGKKE